MEGFLLINLIEWDTVNLRDIKWQAIFDVLVKGIIERYNSHQKVTGKAKHVVVLLMETDSLVLAFR